MYCLTPNLSHVFQAQLAKWYPDPPCLDLRSGRQGDQSELHVSPTYLAAMTDLD